MKKKLTLLVVTLMLLILPVTPVLAEESISNTGGLVSSHAPGVIPRELDSVLIMHPVILQGGAGTTESTVFKKHLDNQSGTSQYWSLGMFDSSSDTYLNNSVVFLDMGGSNYCTPYIYTSCHNGKSIDSTKVVRPSTYPGGTFPLQLGSNDPQNLAVAGSGTSAANMKSMTILQSVNYWSSRSTQNATDCAFALLTTLTGQTGYSGSVDINTDRNARLFEVSAALKLCDSMGIPCSQGGSWLNAIKNNNGNAAGSSYYVFLEVTQMIYDCESGSIMMPELIYAWLTDSSAPASANSSSVNSRARSIFTGEASVSYSGNDTTYKNNIISKYRSAGTTLWQFWFGDSININQKSSVMPSKQNPTSTLPGWCWKASASGYSNVTEWYKANGLSTSKNDYAYLSSQSTLFAEVLQFTATSKDSGYKWTPASSVGVSTYGFAYLTTGFVANVHPAGGASRGLIAPGKVGDGDGLYILCGEKEYATLMPNVEMQRISENSIKVPGNSTCQATGTTVVNVYVSSDITGVIWKLYPTNAAKLGISSAAITSNNTTSKGSISTLIATYTITGPTANQELETNGIQFDVTVTNKTSAKLSSCNITVYASAVQKASSSDTAKNARAGGKKVESTYVASDTTGYYSGVTDTRESWEWHTDADTKFYAEIRANECRNEDWEVVSGIPSTENTFVACGGDLFQVDVGGWTIVQGEVTRTITYNVTIKDSWGTNVPCTLSCPGHVLASGGNSYSNSDSHSATGIDAPVPASKLPSWTCPVCGDTLNAQDSGEGNTGHSIVMTGSPPNQTPKIVASSGSTSVSYSHSCVWTLTYSCQTGRTSLSSTHSSTSDGTSHPITANPSSSSNYNPTQQWYVIDGTVSNGNEQKSFSWHGGGLIDQGYTKGTGCVCSHNNNCIHHANQTYTFVTQEKIIGVPYLNICKYNITGLWKAQIESTSNSRILKESAGQSSSNVLSTYVWDLGNSSYGSARGDPSWAKYGSGDGRIIWEKFAVETGSSGSARFATSPASGDNYCLGNVLITASFDYDDVNYQNIEASEYATLQGGSKFAPLSNVGMSHGHFKDGEVTSNNTSYKSAAGTGDWCNNGNETTPGVAGQRMAIACVNWIQYLNNGGVNQDPNGSGSTNIYGAYIVSDALGIGAQANGSTRGQNIVSTIVALKGRGIFSYPFTSVGQTQTYYMAGGRLKATDTPSYAYTEGHGNVNITYTANLPVINTVTLRDVLGQQTFNNGDIKVINTRNVTSASTIIHAGYCGTVSSDYSTRYSGINENTVGLNDILAYKLTANSTLPDYVGAGGSNNFTPRSMMYGTSGHGVTYQLASSGSASGSNFSGYYQDYAYPARGSYTITSQGKGVSAGASQTLGTVTNSGPINIGSYSIPLVMSNLQIVSTTPNGLYDNVVAPYAFYTTTASQAGSDTDWSSAQYNSRVASRSSMAKVPSRKQKGGGNYVNDIVIHTPVSTQYCEVVSNDDVTDNQVTSTSFSQFANIGNDERWYVSNNNDSQAYTADAEGDLIVKDGNSTKHDYVMSSKEFYIFWSDYGDFYDANGASTTGQINGSNSRGVGRTGYATNRSSWTYKNSSDDRLGLWNLMDTGPFMSKRYVKFQFPIVYTSTSGQEVFVEANTNIDISSMQVYSTGVRNMTQNANVKTPIESYSSKYVKGNYYKIRVPSSSNEFNSATVDFISIAINNNSGAIDNQSATNRDRGGFVAKHSSDNTDYIDVVGWIGNVELTDSDDPRTEFLFKNAGTETQRVLLSTQYNLLGDKTAQRNTFSNTSANGDGTLPSTMLFPLSAYTVGSGGANSSEYYTSPLRPGYASYGSIDTIGSYSGVGNSEMKIDLSYFYVDPDSPSTWTPVDIYAGAEGQQGRYYSFNGKTTNIDSTATQEVVNKVMEYNIVPAEKFASYLTKSSYAGVNNWNDYYIEKIGNSSTLHLKDSAIVYNGSSMLYGRNGYGSVLNKTGAIFQTPSNKYSPAYGANALDPNIANSLLISDDLNASKSEVAYNYHGQRWLYNITLPSTAIFVKATDNPYTSAQQITNANQELVKSDTNDNAVVICMLKYRAYGDVWNLKYNNMQDYKGATQNVVSGGSTKSYSFKVSKNDDGSDNTVTVPEKYSNLTPWIVYDVRKTSADDYSMVGTH